MKPTIIVTDSSACSLSWVFVKILLWYYGCRAIKVSPNHQVFPKKFEGIILLGGYDVHPSSYGRIPNASFRYDRPRDDLEMKLTRKACENKVPLLGICRGMQLMNVALGGTLYEDVSEVYDNFFPTQSLLGKMLTRRKVRILEDSMLSKIMMDSVVSQVNSLHHQGIHLLGKDLQVCAWEENGLIQGVELDKKQNHPFFVGVQWHPEFMLYKKTSRSIFWEFHLRAKKLLNDTLPDDRHIKDREFTSV